MIRRRHIETRENHDRWLLSYADFITLVLAVFMVIASAHADKFRAGAIGKSVRSALEKAPAAPAQIAPVLTPPPAPTANAAAELIPSMDGLKMALAAELSDGKIDIRLEPRGLVVSLRQAAYFPSGGDQIAPDTYASIGKIAQVIRDLPNMIRLEGHSDARPIHTARFRSNWELSAARSIAMMQLLADDFGVARSRLAIAGYADMVPIESNETEAGRSHNRRVDVVILNQTAVGAEPAPHDILTRAAADPSDRDGTR